MTAIPATARTLTDLSTVAPADAALMLLRSGSTDGKTTIATLINYILGPQLVACIGGAGAAESFALTTSWTVIDFTTCPIWSLDALSFFIESAVRSEMPTASRATLATSDVLREMSRMLAVSSSIAVATDWLLCDT